MDVRPVIFSAVLSGTLWLTTPLRVKYLDPHIVQWSESLNRQPQVWLQRIGLLLQKIGVPTTQVLYLFVIVLIVAKLSFSQPDPPSPPEIIVRQLDTTETVVLYNLSQEKSNLLEWPSKENPLIRYMSKRDAEAMRSFIEWAKEHEPSEDEKVLHSTLRTLKEFGLVTNIRLSNNGSPTADMTKLGKKVVQLY